MSMAYRQSAEDSMKKIRSSASMMKSAFSKVAFGETCVDTGFTATNVGAHLNANCFIVRRLDESVESSEASHVRTDTAGSRNSEQGKPEPTGAADAVSEWDTSLAGGIAYNALVEPLFVGIPTSNENTKSVSVEHGVC